MSDIFLLKKILIYLNKIRVNFIALFFYFFYMEIFTKKNSWNIDYNINKGILWKNLYNISDN